MALSTSGQGAASPSWQATFCLVLFPKGLLIEWESQSDWGGIGACRGFHSHNDAGEAFSAGHLLPAGLGTKGLCEINPGALMSSSFSVFCIFNMGDVSPLFKWRIQRKLY